jgi:hypothetical protein
MTSISSDPQRNNGIHDQPDQGRSHATYLEIARQIARETLKADHQALELHTRITAPPATADA